MKKIKLETEMLQEKRDALKAIQELAVATKHYVINKNIFDFSSGNLFLDSMSEQQPQ